MRRLDVSRNTLSLAYEWLAAEGLLEGRNGGGSFVEGEPISRTSRRSSGAPLRIRSVWKGIEAPRPRDAAPRYDFGVGRPDAALFPFDTWRRLLARRIRPSMLTAEYGDPAGHTALRAAIARYVTVSRGVNATPEDVIVTSGAQGAFDVIARVLVEPGAVVAFEEPGAFSCVRPWARRETRPGRSRRRDGR